MDDHLSFIKERGYPTEVSKILINYFYKGTDFALRGYDWKSFRGK